MPNLDETVDGLMLPGHHAKTGTPEAFLPHNWTRSGRTFESTARAWARSESRHAFAGHWDIPVIFVQGMSTACEEAREIFPWIVTSMVKWATESPEVC